MPLVIGAATSAGGMTLTLPAIAGVFSAGLTSITQGVVTLAGLPSVCTPNADGTTTRVVVTLTAAQVGQLTAGPVTGAVTPTGGAGIPFLATLAVFPVLLAVSSGGVYDVVQGQTRVGVPFYLPSVYLPGLTRATLRLRPLISGAPLFVDLPAGMQGTALALDGLYPASSSSPAAVPFLRLDFPAGWGQADIPAGFWLAEAVLTYIADGSYPGGRVVAVPLYPDDGTITSGAAIRDSVLLITPSPGTPAGAIAPISSTDATSATVLALLSAQSTTLVALSAQVTALASRPNTLDEGTLP